MKRCMFIFKRWVPYFKAVAFKISKTEKVVTPKTDITVILKTTKPLPLNKH